RAALTAGDRLLDLAQVLAARRVDPRALGVAGRDARQLADRRERELAFGERVRKLRHLVERERDPHAFLRSARAVAEHLFEILEQRGLAELAPDLVTRGGAQQLCLFGVERAAPLGDRAQVAIDLSPTTARAVAGPHVIRFDRVVA